MNGRFKKPPSHDSIMGFCVECGHNLPDGMKFCRFCGSGQPGLQLIQRLRAEAERIRIAATQYLQNNAQNMAMMEQMRQQQNQAAMYGYDQNQQNRW